MNMVCIFIIIGLCCYLHDSIFTFLRGGHVGTFIKYYKISQLIHTQSIAN